MPPAIEPVLPDQRGWGARLGFGTAFLTGGFAQGSSKRLLEQAYDAGIRHFDTAPSYGLGLAEDILGQALKRQRSQIAIATKFGRPRPKGAMVLSLLKSALRPLLKRRSRAGAHVTSQIVNLAAAEQDYSVAALEASLVESLRRLRTDYVDLLLLHDIPANLVTDEICLHLERCRDAGKILNYGIATDFDNAAATLRRRPEFSGVVQTSWTPAASGRTASFEREIILYRVIQNGLAALPAGVLPINPDLARHMTTYGKDNAQSDAIVPLMLTLALDGNPGARVLFSSRNPDHLAFCCAAVREPQILLAARSLAPLLTGPATNTL